MKFWKWLKNLFASKPTPTPQPSPKPPVCTVDLICDDHDRDFQDPKKPEVSTWTPTIYRKEFEDLWDSMIIPALRMGSNGKQSSGTITWTVTQIRKNEARYRKCSEFVFQKLGRRYPWELIGALHMREAGGNFSKNMMNGQALNKVTTWVPKGYGPWSSWEESVVDAFKIKSIPDVWSISNTLYFAEKYNGMGYRTETRRKIVGYSPYIWAFSSHYKGGYFVSDGKFSSSAVALGVGVAVILKELGYKPQ